MIASTDRKDTGLVALRRRLHAHPELSGEERQTAAFIAAELRKLSPEVLLEGLGGTGVAAVFDGLQPGPVFLFRAALDALPIEEVNEFDHRSKYRKVSHKCGHDGHMAVLLGLARKVACKRPPRGRVIVLFQPAEETGEGAQQVLDDPRFGQLRPDYAVAFHNLPGYPMGAVVTRNGAFTAGVRSLIIRLRGKTSHAAEPEHGINPAPAIAELLQMSDQLTQPDPARTDFQLITPVHITMGEPAYGVSAGYGEVHLTVRCWTGERMEQLAGDLLSRIGTITGKYGLDYDTEWTNVFRANFNDAGTVQIIREAALRNGLLHLERRVPLKWGEDFGAFTQRFKGAMFGLGAGENTPALHNPDYEFPDELIGVGVELFGNIVRLLLN